MDRVRNKPDASETRKDHGAKLKRPYAKPAFQHEKVFETMALACGKIAPTQGSCHFNRKNS
jgi:hypothetical protein